MNTRHIVLGSALAGLTALAAALAWLARPDAARAVPQPVKAGEASALEATVLWFREQEQGTDPYTTRVIVTERWLRMDDGRDGGDFVLLDRRARTVYSVVHGDRAILVVPYREVHARPPVRLEYGVEETPQTGAPRIEGRQVVHYRFSVNGQTCRDVMAVPGLLQEAVAALRELAGVMAGEHGANLARTPVDMQRQMLCDLAESIFAPGLYLEKGLPVQEWSEDGYRRSLVDYRRGWQADPALFVLPAGYRRFTVSDIAGPAQDG